MTAQPCGCNPATGAMCEYALSISDVVAKRALDYRAAMKAHEERGMPFPYVQHEALVRVKNELTAHMHGVIPPHERETFCDCCGARGVQHQPENVNERGRA